MTRRFLTLFALAAAPAAWAQPAPVPPENPNEPTTIPDDTQPAPPPVPSDPPIDTTTTDTLPAPAEEPTFEMKNRTYTTTTTESDPTLFDELGFGLSAGGGVSGFTDETARSATQDGGGWNVRATVGLNSPIAAEVSYIGSAQSIDALGIDDNAVLMGNGVQAAVRLNLTTGFVIQPFVFAGAAWRRYDLVNTDTNTSDVADSDNVFELPVGAGFSYKFAGFLLDARGEYRRATEEDLLPSLVSDSTVLPSGDQASLHRWGVTANIGVAF